MYVPVVHVCKLPFCKIQVCTAVELVSRPMLGKNMPRKVVQMTKHLWENEKPQKFMQFNFMWNGLIKPFCVQEQIGIKMDGWMY